ncbi:MAG: hypothetical protein D3908_12715 [Candidatus Electrothrix sp. AUS4]|nr:hypothetical protein [Candidatus Electrothrix sp. AUS4]
MKHTTSKQPVLLSLFLLSLILPTQGQAHAVHGETGSSSEALCTSASYDDGGPMSYASVEITAPNAEVPFQSGRTDRNGYFCFRPDAPGRWKITIKDEDGHFIRLGTKVSKEMLNQH